LKGGEKMKGKERIIIEEKDGCLNANNLKGWFFPNWFSKEHFSEFLNKKVNDKEFELWKEYLEDTGIFDDVSTLMSEYLNDNEEDFKEWKKEREE